MAADNWLLSWLTNLNLTEYQETFHQRGYLTPHQVSSIVERDQLKALGVNKMGHVNRLFRAIEKLRDDGIDGESRGGGAGQLVLTEPSLNSGLDLHNSTHIPAAVDPGLHQPNGTSKKPPPVPVRKRSMRQSSSTPSIHSSNTLPVSATRDHPPPPVRPRDQSLKRFPVKPKPAVASKPGRHSEGSILTTIPQSPSDDIKTNHFSPERIDVNSITTHADMSNNISLAAQPHSISQKPLSPTPRPRPKHPPKPVPRIRSPSRQSITPTGASEKPLPVPKAFSTLPPGSGLQNTNVEKPISRSPPRTAAVTILSSASDSLGGGQSGEDFIFALENVPMPPTPKMGFGTIDEVPVPPKDVGPVPPKDMGPPSFAPPPLLPEREDSLPSGVPPLPNKNPGPPSFSPPPLLHEQESSLPSGVPPLPEKNPGPPSFAPPPLLPERESSLPSGVPPLPDKNPGPPSFAPPPFLPERKSSFPSGVPPLPDKNSGPPALSPEHDQTSPLPPIRQVETMTTGPKPPPRSSTLPTHGILSNNEEDEMAQLKSSSSPSLDGGNDRIEGRVNYLPSKDDSDEELPIPESDSEEEGEGGGKRYISIQSSKSNQDDVLLMARLDVSEEETPFTSQECSPQHSSNTLIHQQSSGSRQDNHDDDIIIGSNPLPEEDHDYMNDKAVDEEMANLTSGSEDDGGDEDKLRNGVKRVIVSQREASRGDDILGIRGGNPDYINQESIGEIDINLDFLNKKTSTATAKVNKIPIGKAPAVNSGSDYMNQERIDEIGSTELVDEWNAIEYMNQDIIDQVQMEIDKGMNEKKGNDYMNQGIIDATFQDAVDTTRTQKVIEEAYDLYDTEDDFTEDDLDDEDDDRIKIHSYREPLQIRGTSPIKARTASLNPNKNDQDYMNQDLLDGDIIPMVIAPNDFNSESSSSDHPLGANLPVQPYSDGFRTDTNFHGLKTQAEASNSSNGTHGGFTNEADTIRAPICQSIQEDETCLDFGPKRPASSRSSDELYSHRHQQKEQQGPKKPVVRTSSLGEPILAKKRSQTEGDIISTMRESQDSACSSQATTPGSMDVDFGNPLHRDYIPPVLPKSAGTFAGIGGDVKRPEFKKFISTTSALDHSGSLALSSQLDSSLLPGLRLGSMLAQDVPKTKEGFLHKKGGRRNERPWQRRWVTFNGSELKYFKNKSDKDNLCLNTVELEKMIDVKRVPDEIEKQYRFDLVVINRVFQFFADSVEECQLWVNVLHVAISKFKPQEHEHKEGGSMHNPDKQGYLQKQGHGAFSSKSFKERYVALKGSKFAYYETQEDFKQGRPIHTLEMCLSSIRPERSSKFPRFIITMNNQKQYMFQACTDLERNEWIEALTGAVMMGLNLRPQTLPRGGSRINDSRDVLLQVQENPANKTCADCLASDPVWGVINRGIMVCINCSGVHRSFGTHMSKVRSIELDEEIWKNDRLVKLMVEIGNKKSNEFWEKHYQRSRLPADVEKEIRENFIRAKYVMRSWIPVEPDNGELLDLDHSLCKNVATDNLMKTIELLARGANPCHLLSDVEDSEKNTPLAIAKSNNQVLQAELLELNGASICRKEDRQAFVVVSKKGHLYKTGSDRTGWKRRYCTLDQSRGFEYFKTETDSEVQGYIHVEEMFSIAKCEDELSRDSKYRFCFEVNTQGRGYLFSAETEEDMEEWVSAFEKIISRDAADNLGYDKVGYLKKKDPHNVTGWKRRWFTLKGKSLAYYRREREELDEIDLRKVVELKVPDNAGTVDQQCIIQIITDEKAHHLKAESPAEAESWLSALRHTQVSGIPLSEQQLTSNGIPIIIHKCLQFIESTGMDMQGLYRLSGEKSKIRKLILAFNQDARGVVIDPEKYTVHDVTGTLKQFLRSLPDPVITHQLYGNFIATIQSDHEAKLYQIQALIEQLPQVNRETLKRVIGHLKRVIDNESKNKMSISNITSLLGPTLMTVDGDAISFTNTQFECTCVHTMIKWYKWLFQVAEDEDKKEEAIEEAVQKIKEAEQLQKKRAELMSQKQSTISSATDFLTTVYLFGRDGESYNSKITGITSVKDVVEEVVTRRELSPNNYALYLVLGDSESHRVLCFTERLLAVLCSAGTNHFLCLKKNVFWETLRPYFDVLADCDTVTLHVREKKKWRKYPCCLRDNQFIQFKDSKCHNEIFKLGVHEFDVFAGIQQSKIDVKNPMPTRYSFWIKGTKGEEHSRYFCADKEEEMLKIIAGIVRRKYTGCLETPILPASAPPLSSPPEYSQVADLGFGRPFNTSPPLR